MSVLTANVYFLQSPGQGGTQLLSMSTCSLVNHKKRERFFLFAFNSDGNWDVKTAAYSNQFCLTANYMITRTKSSLSTVY